MTTRVSRIGYPYTPAVAAAIDDEFDRIYRGAQGLGGGALLPTPAAGLLIVGTPTGWVGLAPPASGPKYLQWLNSVFSWAQVDPTAINVTGTPTAAKILYGDRWDVPPVGVDLADHGEFGYFCHFPSVYGYGAANATVNGTIATNNQAEASYASFTTGAVAGNYAGFYSSNLDLTRPAHDPTVWLRMRTGADITGVRLWFGLTQQVFGGNVDNYGSTSKYIAFRYSTVAADAGWIGVMRDGTTQSVTASVAAIAASTAYLLKIRILSATGTAYFSVNGGAETALATNMPVSTQDLFWSAHITTTAGGARVYSGSRVWCKYGT